MPLYEIHNKETGESRLISAKTQAEALRHVARTSYNVTKPSTTEVAKLMREGVVFEEVGEDAAAEAAATE